MRMEYSWADEDFGANTGTVTFKAGEVESLFVPADHSKEAIEFAAALQDAKPEDFGFVFNNMRFEIFDEHEGVIYNSGDTIYETSSQDIYNMKISGSSKNMNTFAAELKEIVKQYEKRLDDISVTMTYIREERKIYITIKGVIISTKEDYVFTTILRVWK